jgi:MFS family permease
MIYEEKLSKNDRYDLNEKEELNKSQLNEFKDLSKISYDTNSYFEIGDKKNKIKSVNNNNQSNNSIEYNDENNDENNNEFLKESIPKRLDNLPYSKFHTLIICSLGISWILDGYEVSLLSVLSGVVQNSFDVTEKEIGISGSLYLLGCVIGSLFFGFLASLYGRKTLFNVTLVIYGLSIITTSFSINIYMFFVCRFFTGIAVGGEYSSIFAAIDELIPPTIRGRADLIIDGTWHFGSFLASIISFFVLNNGNIVSENLLMRILFGLGAISIIPVIYMRKYIPESPRWLIYKKKYKEANIVMNSIESRCNFNTPKNMNKDNKVDIENKESLICNEKLETNNDISPFLICSKISTKQITNNDISKNYTFSDIFAFLFRTHRSRFFYALILMSSQAFFYNGIFYSYTLILQNFYSIKKENVGLFLIPLSAASFLGPILFGKYFDSWSRRKMIALTYITSGILLSLTSLNFLIGYFGIVVQQIFWFITFLVASPAASSAHLTISEIFPIEMRSQAMAIFFSMGLGIGGVISPSLFGWLVSKKNREDIFISYLFAAFVMIFAGIFGFYFGVDSEGKSLESISRLENQNKD